MAVGRRRAWVIATKVPRAGAVDPPWRRGTMDIEGELPAAITAQVDGAEGRHTESPGPLGPLQSPSGLRTRVPG
jgi:hypothetical protein